MLSLEDVPGPALVLLSLLLLFLLAPLATAALLLLLYLPGRVVLAALDLDIQGGAREVTCIVCGASVLVAAVYAASFLGIPLSRPVLIAYVAGFMAVLLYLWRRKGYTAVKDGFLSERHLFLSMILFLGVATRFLPVSEMNAPLFADPAVEGTFAKLIAMTGGIPATWEPFALLALHHQPGFASITAAVHILSGVPIPRVVLVLGALVHALFPLAVFVLADALMERRKAVVAAFVALLAAFPSYSFIAGMNSANLGFFMAVVVAALSISYLREPDRRMLALVGVTAVGTVLVHPLGLVVLGFLLLPEALRKLVAVRRGDTRVQELLWLGGTVSLLPVVVSLPHYLPLLRGGSALAREQFAIQSAYILPESGLSLFHVIEPFYVNFLNGTGAWYVPAESGLAAVMFNPLATVLLIAAVLTAYRGYRKHDPVAVSALGWYGIFLLFSTVQAAVRFEFPLHSFIYPSRVKFLFAVPIAVLSAAALRDVEASFRGRTVPILLATVLLLSPVALFSIFQHMDQLSSDPVVSDADRDAVKWLGGNVEEDAVVLNELTDVEAGAFIGGPGQWIPAYTGNPVVFPATSITGNVSVLQDRRRFMQAMRNGSRAEFQSLMEEYNVSYIYLSENTMNGRGEERPLNRDRVRELCSCPTVYENEDVTILGTPQS